MTILRAGRYAFGKNLPYGMYDIFVLSGEGMLTITCKDEEILWTRLGDKNGATEYRGIDSEVVKCFTLDGDVEVRIAKAQMIEIED